MSPLEVWLHLEKLGCRSEAQTPKNEATRWLWIGGRKVFASLGVTGGDSESQSQRATILSLSFGHTPQVPVTPKHLQMWAGGGYGMAYAPTARAGLSGEIRVSERIRLGEGATIQRLRAELEDFRFFVEDLVSRFPAGPSAVRPKVDPKAKVESLDQMDTQFLVESWDLAPKGGFGGSFKTWAWPAEVRGLMVWIEGDFESGMYERYDRITLSTAIKPPANTDIRQLEQSLSKKLSPIKAFAGENEIALVEWIDLSTGLTYGDLKKRLERFAKIVSAHAKKASDEKADKGRTEHASLNQAG